MDDTVNRLRIWADGMEKQKNVVVSVLMTEAADEIERLREQLRLANIDNFNTTVEVERLRKERDEVRRNLCFTEAAVLSFGPNGVPYHPSVAHKIAKEDYGWDCFKEQP